MKHLYSILTAMFLIAGGTGVSLAQDEAQEEAQDEAQTEAQQETAETTMDAAGEPAASPYEGLDVFVDSVVDAHMKALDIPAVTVSIVKDGKVIFAKGYGIADFDEQRPVTADKTLFRVGSTSKLFTWTAVMQQYERGNLDLDADVNTYLKTFQIPDAYGEPITPKNLLTHTPGFEEGGIGYLIRKDPKNIIPLRESMARYIPARINPPGKYSSYSNYGAALAGLIVENLSGMPFNEYIKQEILDPLGMTMSSFEEPLPGELGENMATAYKREVGVFKAQPFEIISNFGPAGALSATASDMAKFMIAHLSGGQLGDAHILSPETTALMHSQLFAADERLPGMAYGFYEATENGHRLFGHGGDTVYFHTNMLLDQAENLGIFVSYHGAKGGQGRGQFVEAFYDRYYPQPLEPVAAPEDFSDRAGRYAGKYQFWRHNESTIEKAFSLFGGLEVAPTKDNTLLISGFGEPRQFVEVGSNLFRQVDGKQELAFGENESGEIYDLYFAALPFMAASRAPAAQGNLFAIYLPAVSLLLFISVWLGWIYRRKEFKTMVGVEKMAIRFSLATSAANLLFVVTMAVVVTSAGNDLFFDIPMSFKLSLIFPVLAAALTLGVIYSAVKIWQGGCWRMGRRIHYTLVALASIFMVWFYAYWNILGYQLP